MQANLNPQLDTGVEKLPYELLEAILFYVFDIPDDDFSDARDLDRFCRFEEPSHSALRVCKDWCRIGEPLLYHTVVLRSKAQVQALASTLRARPELGSFIQRLRVEGGFGTVMETILLACAPDLAHLFLSFDLRTDDDVSGIVEALAKTNPRRLTLADPIPARYNAVIIRLVDKLCVCLASWSNLVCVFFPIYFSFSMVTTYPGEARFSVVRASQFRSGVTHHRSVAWLRHFGTLLTAKQPCMAIFSPPTQDYLPGPANHLHSCIPRYLAVDRVPGLPCRKVGAARK